MISTAFDTLTAAGAALFAQNARLLTLRFAEGSGIGAEVLLPHRIEGEEHLSRNFRYTLSCLSADMHLELKALLGQPVELGILLPEGGQRLLTGIVTRAEQQGADGGFAKYQLLIEPALAILAHRRNSRVFQDKSVVEIAQTILDEHLAANPVFAASFKHRAMLQQTYPARSYTLQYRETDLAFIERLLFEEGISYRYTHGPEGETSIYDNPGSDTPLHTLVLFDNNLDLPENAQRTIRFHRTEGVESEDAIDQWQGSRQVQSQQTQLASYDYKAVSTHTGEDPSRTRHGDAGSDLTATLEDYDPQTLYYGNSPDDVSRYASLRQQAKDLASKRFTGEGSARSLQPGTWFELRDHPIHDQDHSEQRQFLITGLSFAAVNNLTPEAKNSLGGLLGSATGNATRQSEPPYRNQFTVVRRDIPIVPDYTRTNHQKPTAPGGTTATVVGPQGEEIYTDEHGRIKIQFHWQRTQDHPQGGADLDDKSSTWVRVAYPSAGANWGTQHIPRIGQEVLITFLENDIDRPVVTGVLYNGTHNPPTFSGAGSLPANKTLSGIKSKEYKGSRYNELLLDDSTNEIRAKLSSEHGKSQLNQGYLIHPRTNGKGEPRGEGFELRTDEAGAIRAPKGLILSADKRTNATGKQLDRQEAIQQLDQALHLSNDLARVANTQLANQTETGKDNKKIDEANTQGSEAKIGHQTHLNEAIHSLEKGTNTDKESKSGKQTQAGQQGILLATAPNGIALTTPNSTTLATGTNFDQVAQRDTNQTTGRRWIHNAGESISLFVHGAKAKLKETMKLIAAHGKVQVQAQHGEMELTAEQAMTFTSTQGAEILAAKKEILITCGGAYVRIANGNIELHAPGTVSVKGSNHVWSGPTSMSRPLPVFPSTEISAQGPYLAHYQLFKDDGRPFEDYKYELRRMDGDKLVKEKSDDNGFTQFVESERHIPVSAEKYVMRESERITEKWRAKLASAGDKTGGQ